MIKGGYQKIDLSPADLTASTLRLDGLSKACAGANGKAVLVKLPDGTEAFGAVDETDDGFVLSAMGADSKVSQFNVDDTDDTFTYNEGEDLAPGNATYAADTAQTIPGASSGDPFIPTVDGYITMSYAASVAAGNTTNMGVVGKPGGSNAIIASVTSNNSTEVRECVFAKKGVEYYMGAAGTGTIATIKFVPLIEV